MAKKNKFYITTAIDYVNASPHIGHAFEKIIADAIARFQRLKGKDVWFLTGTDENAQKNEQAAKKAGIPAQEFVDKNSKIFIELCKKLNISNDDFIRTTEERHKKIAQKIFKKVYDKGEIYKGKYEGYYCVGCESFKTEKDLIEGVCPEHKIQPSFMSEDAYFFKLSKYKDKIIKFIEDYVIPETRKNEILTRLKEEGLKDLCVSRTNIEWGIDSPIDKKFKIYVWFDALTNYITGSGPNQKYWPADVHVIGKGINWFHSVIWPAILMSAGYKLPSKLIVHGYLTLKKEKISKSLGNTIDPIELINKYGTDAVRYSLFRCSVFDDSDYSEEILIQRINNELADNLGNLISRVSTLAEKYGLSKAPQSKELYFKKVKQIIETHLNNFELDKALNEILNYINKCNIYIQEKKPWETKDTKVLYQLATAIKNFTIYLYPFIPETSEKISKIFNFEISLKEIDKPLKITKIKKAPILFQKIENKMAQKQIEENKKQEQTETKNNQLINYNDFSKIELKVGKILNAEDVQNADKLYKLEVSFGNEKRTILAGIKQHYSKEYLKGKKAVFVTNLEPRKMKGLISEGMILAAVSDDESKIIFISPEKDIQEGTKIR
ncbi:MAG: methionine--tRNA ligase [Candidatus Pacearchaeota archaeon]|nr:methionine--tRNA ligase [Candidatus Pacearchaeota archaeon]